MSARRRRSYSRQLSRTRRKLTRAQADVRRLCVPATRGR
jgi:hypothetical protein